MSGRVGRPPKPTALKEKQGNPGKRPLKKNEPRPTRVSRVPAPPETLGDQGAKEWEKVATELKKLGLLSILDLTMLEVYCSYYDRYAKAAIELAEHVKETGSYMTTYVNKGGHENEVPHPALKIQKEALSEMRSIGNEFGFTPSSRTRLNVIPETAAPGAKLLNFAARGNTG